VHHNYECNLRIRQVSCEYIAHMPGTTFRYYCMHVQTTYMLHLAISSQHELHRDAPTDKFTGASSHSTTSLTQLLSDFMAAAHRLHRMQRAHKTSLHCT
jgi:hypothetical protein